MLNDSYFRSGQKAFKVRRLRRYGRRVVRLEWWCWGFWTARQPLQAPLRFAGVAECGECLFCQVSVSQRQGACEGS